MSLPFDGTTVAISKSQGDIKVLLENVGFDAIIDYRDRTGRRIIRAEIGPDNNRISFQFEVNIDKIVKELETKRTRARRSDQELRERAGRMAWRALFYSVKSIHDQISLGTIEIAEAFAGQMLLTNKHGKPIRVAEMLIDGASKGTLKSTKQFLLEEL